MDATTQAFLAALIGAVVAGGAVLAWHLSDRQQHHAQPVEEPVVPVGVAAVLSVLRSSAVVVDDADVVLKASAPAYAMGLVRGTSLLSSDLADLVHQVRRDGQIRETELLMSRPGLPARHVTARVAPLGSRLVLALVSFLRPNLMLLDELGYDAEPAALDEALWQLIHGMPWQAAAARSLHVASPERL